MSDSADGSVASKYDEINEIAQLENDDGLPPLIRSANVALARAKLNDEFADRHLQTAQASALIAIAELIWLQGAG